MDDTAKQRLNDAVGKTDPPAENHRAHGSCYLFVSFDLCNSTKFKALYPVEWPSTLNAFYNYVLKSMINDEERSTFHTWKYVGDEVLFYKELYSKDKIRKIIHTIYDVLRETTAHIQEYCSQAKDILSVKAAAWCALVKPYDYASRRCETTFKPYLNYKLNLKSDTMVTAIDFAGPEIDLGFRLGAHTFANRLLISGELASLMYDEAEDNKNNEYFRIVGYESLKGVWADRRYPIIWYEESWENPVIPYAYDDMFLCPYIAEIERKRPDEIKKEKLEGIFSSVNRNNLLVLLKEVKSKTEYEPIRFRLKTENHFVAVCFSRDGKKVLVAQRKKDKPLFPGRYEFGCGQPMHNEKTDVCLKRSYKEDFGIDIELRLKDDALIPLITYDFKKDEQLVFGVRFLGAVDNDINPDSKNHEQAVLMLIERARALKKDECVDGFHTALERGIEALARINSDPAP